MKQLQFERHHREDWEALEERLDALDRRVADDEVGDLPELYRRTARHLALAKDRHYSPALVARLHRLVLRGHQHLYRTRRRWGGRVLQFFLVELPRTVRAERRLFALGAFLLFFPGLVMGLASYADGRLIYTLAGSEQVRQMESMYDPANDKVGRGAERQAASDFQMFGVYVSNNAGIGFRTFAGGLLFGVGTVGTLVFNGLFLGGVAGHLTGLGYAGTFWPFVAGHGAFELTAIVLSGTAGLQLARALYAPGRYGRLGALRAVAPASATIMAGAAVLFLLAAFVEAFWSSSTLVPDEVKYAVAGALWALVAAYFLLAGRARRGS